jgi:hypothetical protein
MRKVGSLLFVGLVSFSSAVQAADETWQATPVQAQAYKQGEGWSAGKIAAVGAGLVAGVFAANATLPLAMGIAAPVVGGTVGAMLGNWAYMRATTDKSMVRPASTMEIDASALFHHAVLAGTR